MIGPYCTPHSKFALALAIDRAVGNVALSVLVLSTKKRCLSFMERFSFFRKFVSKLDYLTRSKVPVITT